MKKIIFTLLSLCIVGSIWAQEKMAQNAFAKAEIESSYCTKKATQDEVATTITWLTSDVKETAYGKGSALTMAAFMEFDQSDIENFNNTTKELKTVTQVQFYIDVLSAISTCNVLLKQGEKLNTATEAVKQAVDKASLVVGWNTIKLQTPYTINSDEKLFIGYQLVTTGSSYPFGAASGTNAKQGLVLIDTTVSNISGNGHVFLIKAGATVEVHDNEIALTSLNIPAYKAIGDSITVTGTVTNFGSLPLTSFKLVYEANGVASTVKDFTGLNIGFDSTYVFTHPQKVPCTALGNINLKITVSKPNNIDDTISNNTLSTSITIYSEIVPRVVLHEVFTSSTCGPCKPGNTQLSNVLKEVDSTQWACIKYQYNFPGTGDPYYTAECGTRGSFYGGISGVPTLNGNGKALVINPNGYTVAQFNALAQVPAVIKLSGTADIEDKTVSLHATVVPVDNITSSNLRFFAAVVEKTTVKNVKSNQETSFNYVMKKFMTNINGDKIDSLKVGVAKTLDYSYTFNGEYRLPANANSPINNATENSVEGFNDLMVIYWVQDISTKMVYQAGKAEDPDPHGASIASIKANEVNFNVFPNPATNQFTIQSNAPFTKVTLVNSLGQTVKNIQVNTNQYQMGTEGLSKGMYLLRVETKQGVSTQKVQIQ